MYVSDILEKDNESIYSKAPNSNYGSCISIYAPYYVSAAKFDKIELNNKILNKNLKNTYGYFEGTSFSSAIVSGVAAQIISENKNIEFNQHLLKEYLIKMSLKNILDIPIDFSNSTKNNYFINNGKKITYSKNNYYQKSTCGPVAGNRKCNNNQCCSPNGYCGYNSYYCDINNGCLSKFGSCTVNKYIPERASKLWIHNKLSGSYYGKPLCLTFIAEGEPAKLKECSYDERQKWIISENKPDRIINFFNPNICLDVKDDEVKTLHCNGSNTIFTNIFKTKNNETLQTVNNSFKCLDVMREKNKELFSLNSKVIMEKCDYELGSTQKWSLEPYLPGIKVNFEENEIKKEYKLRKNLEILEKHKSVKDIKFIPLFNYVQNLYKKCEEYGGSFEYIKPLNYKNSTEIFSLYISCSGLSSERCEYFGDDITDKINLNEITGNSKNLSLIFKYQENISSSKLSICKPVFVRL
ncbi:carbohydrate-binding module family 18 protein [Piromyces sp. E2]|nr:carbohydrate-binding module family 18 protein [Piromyces sp. E2]|eukprot:OUM67193.1 carbohydrate-binding module family 18 protein [Piromyces sp. E2]